MMPMSDDLRTRIADVICGMDALHAKQWSLDVADAVIEELSLMIDDSYRIGYGNAFIVHGYYEVRDSR